MASRTTHSKRLAALLLSMLTLGGASIVVYGAASADENSTTDESAIVFQQPIAADKVENSDVQVNTNAGSIETVEAAEVVTEQPNSGKIAAQTFDAGVGSTEDSFLQTEASREASNDSSLTVTGADEYARPLEMSVGTNYSKDENVQLDTPTIRTETVETESSNPTAALRGDELQFAVPFTRASVKPNTPTDSNMDLELNQIFEVTFHITVRANTNPDLLVRNRNGSASIRTASTKLCLAKKQETFTLIASISGRTDDEAFWNATTINGAQSGVVRLSPGAVVDLSAPCNKITMTGQAESGWNMLRPQLELRPANGGTSEITWTGGSSDNGREGWWYFTATLEAETQEQVSWTMTSSDHGRPLAAQGAFPALDGGYETLRFPPTGMFTVSGTISERPLSTGGGPCDVRFFYSTGPAFGSFGQAQAQVSRIGNQWVYSVRILGQPRQAMTWTRICPGATPEVTTGSFALDNILLDL